MSVFRTILFIAAVFAGTYCALPAVAFAPRPTDGDYALADENIFRRDEVTRCDITIDPADFQFLIDNPDTDEKKRCTIRWRNSVIDETVPDVGIRSRGNLSRGAPRRSWKLDFNEFVPGRDFQSLEEMDINGDYNDPTLLRRMLAHEFLRRMGLPASRTHYVALYFNGEFTSLNIHVEPVDEEFADSWFGNKDGNLYKCLYKGERADLNYRSQEDYDTYGDGETYRETNNDPDSDYTDLREFIAYLNFSDNSEIYNNLHAHINIDGVLRYLAANVATGSWDDYWYGSNNYYLYWNEDHALFELIPYDYDNTFGIDYFNENWATRHFDGWGDGGYGSTPAPLVERIFQHSEWRRQYRRYLREAAAILADPEFQGLAAEWHALIAPYFDGTIESGGTRGTLTSANQHDPYFNDYNAPPNYRSQLDAHSHGIVPFITQRAATLNEQIDAFSTTPVQPAISINEVLASNATTNTDNFGEPGDWIELHNAESFDVDLSGWYLSDAPSSPTLYRIPDGTTIPAGGFLLVWADGQPEQQEPGALHAPFRLDVSGETITLWNDDASGKVLIETLTFPALSTDRSYGRFTDGTGNLLIMRNPTPGASNDGTPATGGGEPRTPPRLFINEFMAVNNNTIVDNLGEHADWLELYNDESTDVDLSGLYLTDNLANPTKWQFPVGVSIPAKGFLLLWADSDVTETAPGHLHTSFGLSSGGEEIGLFDNDENQNQAIHTLTFGPQTADVSEGLLPDGEGTHAPLATPTPGRSNSAPAHVDGWAVW
ncbi:MAG: hypothetical protein PWP23_2901 [Candidatus Sumerlaeota bacterium]|nr:hypothetical protein [Candidatus Sumerlaeota bacterium]